MNPQYSRRRFIHTAGAAGMAFATSLRAQNAAVTANSKLRVLCVGVVGTIGKTDRRQLAAHPAVEIAGLCDVDSRALAEAAAEHPKAFTCRDYREAFAKHGDKFDAVVVATPDHSHAPIVLTAMAARKHVYGQKPLVQQLAEIRMIEEAVAVRPGLMTQLGNQRMANAGRRAAVDILRGKMLGKAVEAYAWVGSPGDRAYFNLDRQLAAPSPPPAHLEWDLWLGPCPAVPYRDGIAPVVWRSLWEYGSNGLGDWGCHVLDVILFAYDELVSPSTVITRCEKSPNPIFHAHPCKSTLTYTVKSDHFVNRTFPVHYHDSNQAPPRAALGLPDGRYADSNMTAVVCEGGTLLLTADGRLEIWREGKMTSGLKMPGLPEYPKMNHWHAWVDNCLGRKAELRTPFKDAARITEATLLAVKATRFPNQELQWDKPSLSFTNNPEATAMIVRRPYRDGFAPPHVA
jgi:predicted dehydrogenase